MDGDGHASEPASAIARLVRANFRRLYDNISLIYPHANADRIVDETFAAASRQLDTIPSGDVEVWLLGIARRRLLRDNSKEWFQANANAVVALMRSRAAAMTDWHLWHETDRTIAAIERMAVWDREVLRLVACLDGLDGRGLSLVLGIPSADADARIAEVEAVFRREFATVVADRDGGGS